MRTSEGPRTGSASSAIAASRTDFPFQVILLMGGQSGRRVVAPVASAALIRLPAIVSFHVNFQMVTENTIIFATAELHTGYHNKDGQRTVSRCASGC